jgi:ABC-type polysaccharide/polyol phosphate export permease
LVIVFMILLALFAAGIGMLLAILNVHFRDTEHFIGILLRLLLYLTPVLYPISRVQKLVKHHGEWVLDVFRLNPLEHFMAVFRNLLYDNRAPALSDVIWCLASAVVVFIIGSVVFVRNERRLVMYL